MKCPFCGIELRSFVQPGYAPAGVPDKVYYDHKITGKCPQGDGHTLTDKTWKERGNNEILTNNNSFLA